MGDLHQLPVVEEVHHSSREAFGSVDREAAQRSDAQAKGIQGADTKEAGQNYD